MDVDIKREEEKKGFLSKKTIQVVTLKVEFSEAEKAAIIAAGVMEKTFVDLPRWSENIDNSVSVRSLVKYRGYRAEAPDLPTAVTLIEETKNQLKALKSVIDASDAPKSEKFTL